MSKIKQDIIGKRFGRLIVIQRVENDKYNHAQYLCKCDCGNQKIIVGHSLLGNYTKSCGCLRKETASNMRSKYNQYDLSGSYGIGYTSKGEEFYFDLEDYNKIKNYYWRTDNQGYLIADEKSDIKIETNRKAVLMHRLILNHPNNVIDHISHNKRDNRKDNLRICSLSQNSMNQITKSNNMSGTKGVNWHKSKNKWRAFIGVKGKHIHLGLFENFDDAVKARKEAEKKYFGEFSYDNSRYMKEVI